MLPFEEYDTIQLIATNMNVNIKITRFPQLSALPYNEELDEEDLKELAKDDKSIPEYDEDDEIFVVIPVDASRKHYSFYNDKHKSYIFIDKNEKVLLNKSDEGDLHNGSVFEVREIGINTYSILSVELYKYLRIHPTDPNSKLDFYNDIQYNNKSFPSDYEDAKWRFKVMIDEEEEDGNVPIDDYAENFEKKQHSTTFDKIFAVLGKHRESFFKRSKKRRKKIRRIIAERRARDTETATMVQLNKNLAIGLKPDLNSLAYLRTNAKSLNLVGNDDALYDVRTGRHQNIMINRLTDSERDKKGLTNDITADNYVTSRQIKKIKEQTAKLKVEGKLIDEDSVAINKSRDGLLDINAVEMTKYCKGFRKLHGANGSELFPIPDGCINEGIESFRSETALYQTIQGTSEGGEQGKHRNNRLDLREEQRESELKAITKARKDDLLAGFNAELYKTRNENDYAQKHISVNKEDLLNKQMEIVYAVEGETRMFEREMTNKDANETTHDNKSVFQETQLSFLKTLNSKVLFYIYIMIVGLYIAYTYETDERGLYFKIFLYLCMFLFPFYIYPVQQYMSGTFGFINALFLGEPYKK